ncbi:DUF84 family protein, partial [Pseudoalteromonas sp. S1608]|uniref:DUF84 family protein n=1 Tax=Pseudoalteromonas sp. S1608 TaxID=579504 RepID=UPI00110C1596
MPADERGYFMDKAFTTTYFLEQGCAIGLLTDHHATRESTYTQALTLDMAPFLYPTLYNQ